VIRCCAVHGFAVIRCLRRRGVARQRVEAAGIMLRLNVIVVGIVGLACVLAGCASSHLSQQTVALCLGFEESWNALALASNLGEDQADLAALVGQTSETWSDLARLNAPSDMTDVVRNASSNLTSFWNASSGAERHAQSRSLRNSAEYVSMQCKQRESAISLESLKL